MTDEQGKQTKVEVAKRVKPWLLMPMINKFGMEKFNKMRELVAREIKTTFAS